MAPKTTPAKKRIVISYANLAPELQELFKTTYPLGYTDAMIRIDKPNGDFFYGVTIDTEEVNYLVKVNVKIDDKTEEELEKEIYSDAEDDDIKGAEDIADTEDSDE